MKRIILTLLILFGISIVAYLSLNEDLPQGKTGKEADHFATKILENLDYDAFKRTSFIEWSFPGGHHYKWNKKKGQVTVKWDQNEVFLDLVNKNNHRVIKPKDAEFKTSRKLINTATNYFNNDSFWLVAPYKLFDKGVSRQLVELKDNRRGLLVTYKKGGSTPGDSYLWIVDDTGRPVSFKMWVRILPLGGLEASWENWKKTQSGAVLATSHELLFMNLKLENVKAYN